MALDRQSIERRDFPIARRGYEIDEVDAHLGRLADEYEELARRGRGQTTGGLASSAAEQVRMIVEAAEQSAADIERESQLEARQLRQDAREEAERIRADAGRQAREHVSRVAEAARGLLDRVEAMDRELGGLLDGLRAGTQRLSADLSLLQASVEDVREAASSAVGEDAEVARAVSAAEPAGALPEFDGPPTAEVADDGEGAEAERPAPSARPAPTGPAVSGEPGEPPAVEPAAWETAPAHSAGERDGARMVALNMALNGVAREDTRHHIEQSFELDDVDSLLDEVYERARR